MSLIIKDVESIDTQLKEQARFNGFRRPKTLSLLEELLKKHGNQIFHVTAKYNYTDITTTLIDYKIGDCFFENSDGMTPLMIAITNKNVEIAKIFYDAQVQQQKVSKNWPDDQSKDRIVSYLVSKMKKEKMDSELIGEILAKVTDCTVTSIVRFRDLTMTESFLKSLTTHVYLNETFEILDRDLEHTLLVLRITPRSSWSYVFCEYVIENICRLHKSKSGKKFLKQIFTAEIFSAEETLIDLDVMLKKCKKENMRIFLKYNLQLIIKESCGQDILASFFGECPDEIFSCLTDENINVNGRGISGKTPLHYASENNVIQNVQMLLERGADPNAFDNHGRTPLSLAIFQKNYDSCVELLLLAGANPHLISDRLEKIFSDAYFFTKDFTVSNQLVVAQFVIYEANQSNKRHDMFFNILMAEQTHPFIRKCRKQVNLLKMKKIRDNQVTCNFDYSMFSILTESLIKVACYVNEKDVQKILTYIEFNKQELIPYYQKLLKKRAEDIIQLEIHRKQALEVVGQFIGIPDPHHLVVNKIVNYLNANDLRKLSLIESQDVSSKIIKTSRFRELTKRLMPKILAKD